MIYSASAVTRRLTDPAFVSDEQRDAVLAHGNFFLLSRPGSGKTRTVGIRVARLAQEPVPRRIAATSYTNVAIEQIAATIGSLGVVLGPEHFAGTLHHFLLAHVLYPFGHLPPVALKRPFQIVGDAEWHGWDDVIFKGDNRKRLSIVEFHYQVDSSVKVFANPWRIGLTRETAALAEIVQVKRLKRAARARGVLSFSDAMFYCMKILEAHPDLCASIAGRYDELIVDEAQDSSDVQVKCLELLHQSGRLRSLVLVGDLDQSIYGFQGASPALCERLARTCRLTHLPLTKNFRSSQAICDVTYKFCGRASADHAVGDNASLGLPPELLMYDPTDPPSVVDIFRARLSHHSLPATRAVVFARARRFRDQINGRREVEGVSRAVATLARFLGTYRECARVEIAELQAVEWEIASMAWGQLPLRGDGDEALRLRRAAMGLLETLPSFAGSLGDWIDGTRDAVKGAVHSLAAVPVRKPSNVIRKRAEHQMVAAASVFASHRSDPSARTVHDAKGESHDAVLLVVEPSRRDHDQTELWSARLAGREVRDEDAEELRIAYVALTRAAIYCAIALPEGCSREAAQHYLFAGFVAPE